MPPPNQPAQPNSSEGRMHPKDTQVGLGIITNLQKYLLPQGQSQPNTQPAQDPTQGAPTNQENPTDVKAQMQGLESRLMDELQTLKKEMADQGDGKKELADLKKQIETILASTD